MSIYVREWTTSRSAMLLLDLYLCNNSFIVHLLRAALTLTPKAVERVKFLTQDCPVPCIGLKVPFSPSLIHSESNTRNDSSGWSETKRLQWYELHPDVCWNKREIWRSSSAGEILTFVRRKKVTFKPLLQDGATVFIDKKAQMSILGTEMDYAESKLASEFVFNNPNITGTCGCGESFSMWSK